ncbi:T9SS type A sorting domain-containing protein [Maribellus mangrovi]|uniref:T9SS type A sorting domain-containing protein n=1 Tax=Maribellus mangrovi TaxID=3133146 RepID=UPI0030EBB33A
MKTKWLIRTGQTVLFLLLLLNFKVPDAIASTNLNSASGDNSVKEINQEVIRNIQSIGSDKISLESNIARIEYFFDTDPGYGNGTPIQFSSGSEITIDDAIPVNSLEEGIHIFFLRVCDDQGHWSQTLNKVFLKTKLKSDNDYNITRVEYFFDADPGYGKGTTAEFTLNSNIIFDNNWPGSSLEDGVHMLYIRALDEFGHWSQTFHRLFLKTQMQSDEVNIEEVEYFFDNDPGIGNGTRIAITPGEKITIEQLISVEELDPGLHSINIRGKFADNKWGQIFHRSFIKYPSYDVVKVEYYFDDDPGLGNAMDLPIIPSGMVIIDDVLPINSLTSGNHTLNVRALSENGQWSDVFTATITVFLTGIDDLASKKALVNVYPNPTNGILNVEVTNIGEPLELQLVSANGSVLLNRKIFEESNTSLDLGSFTNGIYILRFLYKDEVRIQNIILSK